MDLINTASDYLNFTYSIKNPIYGGWMEKDGSYSGLNGAVINKVVDFNIAPLPTNYETSQVIIQIYIYLCKLIEIGI